MDCKENIIAFMKSAERFSIPEVQSEFNMSYGDTRELFGSLVSDKSIELTDGIEYLWTAKEKHNNPPRFLTSLSEKEESELKEEEGDSSDDDPFEVLSVIEKRRRDDWPREIIEGFMKRRGYSEEKRYVRLDMSVSYPDGTPFEIEYMRDEFGHFLTDNGTLKRYLEGVLTNLPKGIRFAAVKNLLNVLDNTTELAYHGGKLTRDAERCFDEDDVSSLVFYFVEVIEEFMCDMKNKYVDKELSESEKYELSVVMEGVAKDSCSEPLFDGEQAYDYPCYKAMKRVAECHENMTRGHAIELAGRMIELAREGENENLEGFEMLFEELSRLSDLEFHILKQEVFPLI